MKLSIQHAKYYVVAALGHGYVTGCISAAQVREFLSLKTDIPGNPSMGLIIEPYHGCFFDQGYMILYKSCIDLGADRKDSVFTHVLIVPEDEAVLVDQLRSLYELLCDEVDKSPSEKPFEFLIGEDSDFETPPTMAFQMLSDLLQSEGEAPQVLFSGDSDEYIQAFCYLWQQVSPMWRSQLSYGLVLSEERNSYVISVTPTGNHLLGMADKSISENSQNLVLSPAARWLLQKENDFGPFIEKLGLQPASFPELRSIESAFLLYNRKDGESLIHLSRYLGKRTPAPEAGLKIKLEIEQFLQAFLPGKDFRFWRKIRNLIFNAFTRLRQICEKGLVEKTTETLCLERKDRRFVLENAIDSSQPQWWRKSI